MSEHLQAQISWDEWGVPHVDAPDDPAAFRALGWAQMHAHAPLLLRLYGLARGRGAEYWGEKYLASDRLIRQFGIPERARTWADAQDPAMRRNLEAFVEGVDLWAQQHASELPEDVRAVLPVTLDDVFAHIQRVYLVYLTSLGQRPAGMPYNDLLPSTTLLPDAPVMGTGMAGSNAWVLSGERTESGRPILLANPHLYWGDAHTFFEVHLRTPRTNLYGVAQVGWPVLRYGFNDHAGWAHTVNTVKGWDAFALEIDPDGYRLDGEVRPFEVEVQSLRVRLPDGTLREERLVIRRSVHGPVVTEAGGGPIAVRCVALDVAPISGIFAQYWAMAHATNRTEFEAALDRHQNALFTVMYADRDGTIAHDFTGFVPRRPGGTWADWAGTLRGDDGRLLWTDVLDRSELPRVVNPASGWLQNANNPPWFTTLPRALDPDAYAAWVAPRTMTPREQRSIHLLGNLSDATLETVLHAANDTRSETADKLLPALLEAARTSRSQAVREALAVLEAWDRRFDAGSVGADLFARWLANLKPDRTLGNVAAEPWSEHAPLETPRGLRDPEAAVRALEAAALTGRWGPGSLSRRWGDVTRASRGRHAVPGHGHLDPFGVFRVSGFAPTEDGRFDTVFGTTYVAAVEFTTPPRARVLLSYGNSSRPDSPHHGDQLDLFARGETREALLTREAVAAHAVRVDRV